MFRTIGSMNSLARRAILLIALAFVSFPGGAFACAIPVFRYALERWDADRFQVILYHDGLLTSDQFAALERLDQQSITHGGPLNIELIRYDLRASAPPKMLVVDRPSAEQTLPLVEIRGRDGGANWVRYWQGAFTTAMTELRWWDSPVRQEIVRRILDGHSAVWLVVARDAEEGQQASATLQKSLDAAVKTIPPPQGIGLPGSELLASVPLDLKFSVLTVQHDNAAEMRLLELLSSKTPKWSTEETYVIPIFGRCRALDVIPYPTLDAAMTDEIAAFICGACSCQVKQANPGFDLLVAVKWEEKLFGSASPTTLSSEDAIPLDSASERPATAATDSGEPQYISIPPGRELVVPDVAEVRVEGASTVASQVFKPGTLKGRKLPVTIAKPNELRWSRLALGCLALGCLTIVVILATVTTFKASR